MTENMKLWSAVYRALVDEGFDPTHAGWVATQVGQAYAVGGRDCETCGHPIAEHGEKGCNHPVEDEAGWDFCECRARRSDLLQAYAADLERTIIEAEAQFNHDGEPSDIDTARTSLVRLCSMGAEALLSVERLKAD